MIPAMLPKIRRSVAGIALAAAVFACFPATARADAGIAMLPVNYETMLYFLLLVILIEAIYLLANLRTGFRRTLIAVTTVNVATTGLGFPLAWGLYAILNSWAIFPGGMSGAFNDRGFIPMWVSNKMFPDWSGMHEQMWSMLAIFITLLVPSYLFTRIVKSWAFHWYDLLRYQGDIRPGILTANRLSYLLLAITGCMLIFRKFHL